MTMLGGIPGTVGIEEEFHLVDPSSRRLVPHAPDVLDATPEGEDIEPELQRSAVETSTDVCKTLEELGRQVEDRRREAAEAAAREGLRVVASGTLPSRSAPGQGAFPHERYQKMLSDYASVGREQLVCSCHVQVGIHDRDLAAHALRRARPWAPVLLALSASSPLYEGEDTGYDSYRTMIWARWPTAGMPGTFASIEEYEATVKALIDSEVIVDEGMIYFDIRLSHRYPTVEFRICDGCPLAADTLLLASLGRGLIATEAAAALQDAPETTAPIALLRAASWRAARSSLTGPLLHPITFEPLPARRVVDDLLDHVLPALEEMGDAEFARAAIDEIFERGNSALRQRRALAAGASIEELVDVLVAETAGEIS